MKFLIHNIGRLKISELIDEKYQINNVQDALDLMVDSDEKGAGKIIIYAENINPDFFDLKTGFAGEIGQKFSNYNMFLAIVVDYRKFTSKSLQDFIYESNKSGRIKFVYTLEEALKKLI